MFHTALAHATVADVTAAEAWYSTVLGGPPDRRPMDGLIEWHLGDGFGVQVFEEPERAGASTVLVGTSDLPGLVSDLDEVGIDHDPVQAGGDGRILQLIDPDGNRVVLIDDDAAGVSPGEVVLQTLRFRREVDASAQRAWEAYADVDQRVQWAVPPGERIVHDRSDFSVGGQDAYRCGPPGDLANHVTIRYHHIESPRGFVFSEDFQRGSRTVATSISRWCITPLDESSVITITVQVASLVGAALVDGFRKGHERTLDHLEEHLART